MLGFSGPVFAQVIVAPDTAFTSIKSHAILWTVPESI